MLGLKSMNSQKTVVDTNNLYDKLWNSVLILVKGEAGTSTAPTNSASVGTPPTISRAAGTGTSDLVKCVLTDADSRFGSKSMYFPAGCDNIFRTDSTLTLAVNCCVDMWIKYTGTDWSETMGLSGTVSSTGMVFGIKAGNVVLGRGTFLTPSTICSVTDAGLVPNQWMHIELNRISTNTYMLFVNGVYKASLTYTNAFGTQSIVIGNQDQYAACPFVGYIDNYRYTTVARHTNTSDVFVPGDAATNVGEALFSTPGTYNFTVPEGVTSICAAAVGAGGNGIQRTAFGGSWAGGGGGGLTYKNNIAVTPGQVITVVVAAPVSSSTATSTTILGLTAYSGSLGVDGTGGSSGGGSSGGDANYSGTGANSLTGGVVPGGDSASLTASATTNNGVGTTLGITSGTQFGAGGSSAHSPTSPTNGQSGGVRIIWGKNRSFPSNTAA